MDYRVPIGAAVIGILLTPLALQLINSTALTPANAPVPVVTGENQPETAEEALRQDGEAGGTVENRANTETAANKTDLNDALPQPAPEPVVEPAPRTLPDADESAPMGNLAASEPQEAEQDFTGADVQELMVRDQAAPTDRSRTLSLDDVVNTEPASVPPSRAPQPMLMSKQAAGQPAPDAAMAGGMFSSEEGYVMPERPNGDRFEDFENSPLKVAAEEPVSTFSIDVDTASYAYVRRLLEEGRLPSPGAVRVEEMINYFRYDYPLPETGDAPFEPTISVFQTPWNPETRLMHVALNGRAPAEIDNPVNLVLLIDTSGSMDEPDKLPLLKRSLMLLLDELGEDDTISIVTYAGSAGTVLEPTSASEKAKIARAIETLNPGGSTAGAAGIELAYSLAEEARIDGGVNRVILATDGDFNVGISEPEQLKDFIADKRDEGTSLSVLGFGSGNYNDALMQALAQNGNGNAAYIDSFREARKVLVEEVGSTLETIAGDVKIQVEFNPAVVAEYRLIGYETRGLAREDFNNDRVDAGDIGAGHQVTAIYEIVPVGSSAVSVDPLRYGEEDEGEPVVSDGPADEFAFFKLRYKAPGESESRLIEQPVTAANEMAFGELPEDVRFSTAVGAFGQKLRDVDQLAGFSFEDIREIAADARGEDEGGYRAEFLSLVDLADSLSARR
ncbi:vWA domain-containing protein [Cucumibacter marinus]|uniref:vWA domain-containing protein n=1 Tax=Cucumibacter marinus TaxID=1121252 RepID=UPI001FE13CC4|nr:VWA domain-containing protein [Cucumibacter marinus]